MFVWLLRLRRTQDEAYNRVHAGCLSASTRLGDSTLAVVGLLHRGAAAAPADEFRAVVLHLRMLAEQDLDSIDFFWPQVLRAGDLQRCDDRTMSFFFHESMLFAGRLKSCAVVGEREKLTLFPTILEARRQNIWRRLCLNGTTQRSTSNTGTKIFPFRR